jgi:hypothetical protein
LIIVVLAVEWFNGELLTWRILLPFCTSHRTDLAPPQLYSSSFFFFFFFFFFQSSSDKTDEIDELTVNGGVRPPMAIWASESCNTWPDWVALLDNLSGLVLPVAGDAMPNTLKLKNDMARIFIDG